MTTTDPTDAEFREWWQSLSVDDRMELERLATLALVKEGRSREAPGTFLLWAEFEGLVTYTLTEAGEARIREMQQRFRDEPRLAAVVAGRPGGAT